MLHGLIQFQIFFGFLNKIQIREMTIGQIVNFWRTVSVGVAPTSAPTGARTFAARGTSAPLGSGQAFLPLKSPP